MASRISPGTLERIKNVLQNTTPKQFTIVAVIGFIYAAVTLSFYAATIDTVRKLKDGDKSVPQSTINFVYTGTSVGLIVSVVTLIFFGVWVWKLVKR